MDDKLNGMVAFYSFICFVVVFSCLCIFGGHLHEKRVAKEKAFRKQEYLLSKIDDFVIKQDINPMKLYTSRELKLILEQFIKDFKLED